MSEGQRSEGQPDPARPTTRGGCEATPLLATKLHRPALPAHFVPRRRLLDRLEAGRELPLVLVSAPAGYGKSTLVAEWLEGSERSVAWISLDRVDSDLATFLSYVVASIEALFPGACAGTRSALRVSETPPAEVLAGRFVNELDAIDASVTLVLDDYHHIQGNKIHDLVGELLRFPPADVHVVIATRRDPPLPLASMRAGNRMVEIRFDDLRFSRAEVGELMGDLLGLTLSEGVMDRLMELTEGWVAGLQLVALAARHRPEPEKFLLNLKGTIQDIRDYLLSEVLAQQPAELRGCILKTAMVDRFSGSFCAGVCENREGCPLAGERIAQTLLRTGIFTIPLDAEGKWFRYHHLFQDLLREQLMRELGADQVGALHNRASGWFEGLGLIEDAIDQALAAADPLGAAKIVENHLHGELNADRWQVVERWLERIPLDVQQERTELLLGAACVAIERSRVNELPALVERIDVLIDDATARPGVLGALNLLRGEVQYWQGEPERAHELFVEARGQIPSSQHLVAGENELHAALALQALGRYDEARNELAVSTRSAGTSAPVYLARLVAGQVFIDTLAGELAAAAEGARRLESLGKKRGIAYVELWGAYMQVLAQFHWLETEAMVQRFSNLAEEVYLMHSRVAVDTLAVLALGSDTFGRADASGLAAQLLREFAEESGNPELRNVAGSCRARLAVRHGDFESAVRWQRSLREHPDFPSMLFWVENPLITECRILTARGSNADLRLAEAKLAVLREGFASLHNTCQLIEVDVLTALALEKQGRASEALDALGEAVALGEPGRWIRPFVELGDPMEEMLGRLEPTEEEADYVRHLQAGFCERETAPAKQPAARPAFDQPLIEPLTNRELDVLELIAKRLYDKEIADQLSISPGTVKSHLKHIYQKLDVGNRRAAVDRALALGVLKRGE